MNEKIVERIQKSQKFLGAFMDQSVSWGHHVKHVPENIDKQEESRVK